jgi:uncharacterized repeat protein (TIGR03987 family)
MSGLLISGIVFVFSALAIYTIAVWGVRLSGRLKVWHTVLFWVGLVFDATSTAIMAQIAGKFEFNLHGITGVVAFLLMLGNAVWAGVALVTKKESTLQNFYKYSLIVWIIWLIPFFSGMFGAMQK